MAVVAAVIGAVAGTAATFTGLAVFATIAKVATLVGTVASLFGGGNKAPDPGPARGSVTQVLIDPNSPQPYVMGEGYFAGVLRHDTAWGATLNGVPNPYRGMVVCYSGSGPVEGINAWVDLKPDVSWYNGFLHTIASLGETPQTTALTPPWAGMPGWGAASKMSGQAHVLWSLQFDRDGKRFASGIPPFGMHGKWVKVYDPRKDSTFPGGSGPHRLGVESTYEWSENPALHAATYAYGRYQNGKRVFGGGLPITGIDLTSTVAWANVCDANAWTLFGVIYEPGSRGDNLRQICAAGGGTPVFARGILSFRFESPKVRLDTITAADLSGEDSSITPQVPFTERLNKAFPKYRSPEHNWELVSALAITVATWRAMDGEDKTREIEIPLCKKAKQAAELTAYKMAATREINPIVLSLGPRLRHFRPGDCLGIDLPEHGLDQDAIILSRTFDPGSMTITLTMTSETAAKHPFALGQTANPPPLPLLGQTAQQRDELAAVAAQPAGFDAALIASSYTSNPAAALLVATESTITVANHDRTYSDKAVAITGATITTEDDGTTALTAAITYNIYYDDPARAGGVVAFKASQSATVAANSPDTPTRHYVGSIATAAAGGADNSGYGSLPPGWNYGDWWNGY